MFSLDYLFLRNQDGVLLFNVMPQIFYTLHTHILGETFLFHFIVYREL